MADVVAGAMSRRELLERAGGVAAATVAASLLGRHSLADALAGAGASDPAAGGLTFAQFSGQVGTWFELRSTGQTVRVRLLEAAPSAARRQDGRPTTGEAFSLLFDAAPAGANLHGISAGRHPSLGTFTLFVSPVGVRSQLEAVVNRTVAAR